MRYNIHSTANLRGVIHLPASKSISNRALVINALARNSVVPQNVSNCDDTNVMLRWLGDSSADENGVRRIDIGAAGTAMRFSTALLSVTDGVYEITGTERMRNRPIGILVEALRRLGAKVEYVEKDGYPPLRIKGDSRMRGGEISISGSVSSQFISALLMVGPSLAEGLTLSLQGNVVSRPYIDMTLNIMREFGASAEWVGENMIKVAPVPYNKREYFVESDWSASSYWYEMVALSCDEDARIEMPYLFAQSLQGDSEVARIFSRLGVTTEFTEVDGMPTAVIYKGGASVDVLEYDFVEQPDLAQTFVVTCCVLGIRFHFTGLQSLKIKETDRIEALKKELLKLGYVIADRNDCELHWNGERCEPNLSAGIDTYEDHRMAMAFAPAALRMEGLLINNPHVVSKSYPKYWEDLRSVGFSVTEVQ